MDILSKVRERHAETYDLHKKYINPQFVRVLEVIGFNRNYVSGKGARLIDSDGREVLDFLAGFGVFNIGRNHPLVAQVLHQMLDSDPANMVQMDLGGISGLLAEALAKITPGDLDAVFFTNSGAESVEGALKFARQATRRHKVVHCHHAFHGLTLGALSVNGNREFRDFNEPLLPGCIQVPFNDLEALERALSGGDVAAFIVEPIQGKGVFVPDDDYLPGARRLCDKYGTLLIADEVQTGFGRTGKMFAVDHWDVVPDVMAVSKALSGGFVPVGAVITRRSVHARVFDSMDRCFAHSNTFGQNDLAMAAGLATLEVLQSENLPARAAETGTYILDGLREKAQRYEMLHEIRGKGLMIGMQFGEPRSLTLKAGWKLVHKMNADLFGQMITMPLMEKHHILTQVAGHGLDTVKILPPLVIGKQEADMFLDAMETVLKDVHRFPGSAWATTKDLAMRTMKSA
ncbi:aspartate aminotransferase family protein [Syntrophotalea acetylenica]|jgi:ornithine--oxo-acid transaminase|uniref:Taurine--pyruvate aminotransferase n=1 Tax=Syntrophotalea acetylenica TaxID=29542 RepID=A0A1L3GHN8_SYNAC|nr:aspartate aminotransferase family protein [Syntrophotalea acetylenica]APG25462.1 aminotransferase [Syntrophotalea acetylenica]APG43526.1 aminotransferase [Syntrophotalea acetylenica]MDY0262035.1 aspartate aminotransferase family protein [Syntrophotalea acetylenica]